MSLTLINDGTLDTVIVCSECHAEFRSNYNDQFDNGLDVEECEHGVLTTDGCETCYQNFVAEAFEIAAHECPTCKTCGRVITQAQVNVWFLRSDEAADCLACDILKTRPEMREAFEAGWRAGKDYLQPPTGPCFVAKDAIEAYQHWLKERFK